MFSEIKKSLPSQYNSLILLNKKSTALTDSVQQRSGIQQSRSRNYCCQTPNVGWANWTTDCTTISSGTSDLGRSLVFVQDKKQTGRTKSGFARFFLSRTNTRKRTGSLVQELIVSALWLRNMLCLPSTCHGLRSAVMASAYAYATQRSVERVPEHSLSGARRSSPCHCTCTPIHRRSTTMLTGSTARGLQNCPRDVKSPAADSGMLHYKRTTPSAFSYAKSN